MTAPRPRRARHHVKERKGTAPSPEPMHVMASSVSGSLMAIVSPQRSRAVHLVPSAGMDVVEFVITWTNGLRGTLQTLRDNGREVLDCLPTGDGITSYKYETFHAGEHVLEWDVVSSGEMTSLRAHAGVNDAHMKQIADKDKAQRWQDGASI